MLALLQSVAVDIGSDGDLMIPGSPVPHVATLCRSSSQGCYCCFPHLAKSLAVRALLVSSVPLFSHPRPCFNRLSCSFHSVFWMGPDNASSMHFGLAREYKRGVFDF